MRVSLSASLSESVSLSEFDRDPDTDSDPDLSPGTKACVNPAMRDVLSILLPIAKRSFGVRQFDCRLDPAKSHFAEGKGATQSCALQGAWCQVQSRRRPAAVRTEQAHTTNPFRGRYRNRKDPPGYGAKGVDTDSEKSQNTGANAGTRHWRAPPCIGARGRSILRAWHPGVPCCTWVCSTC